MEGGQWIFIWSKYQISTDRGAPDPSLCVINLVLWLDLTKHGLAVVASKINSEQSLAIWMHDIRDYNYIEEMLCGLALAVTFFL